MWHSSVLRDKTYKPLGLVSAFLENKVNDHPASLGVNSYQHE